MFSLPLLSPPLPLAPCSCQVAYRPLIFYAVTELIGLFGHFQLTFRIGFVAAGETDIATYYVSSPADGAHA